MQDEGKFGKNYWIALTLSMVVLMGYPMLVQWISPESMQTQTQEDPSHNPETGQTQRFASTSNQESYALQPAEGPFLEKPTVKPTIIPFKTDLYDVQFSTLGGNISRLFYKGTNPEHPIPDALFYETSPETARFAGVRFLHDGTDLSKVVFKASKQSSSDEFVEFFYEQKGEYRLTKRYLFETGTPAIKLDLKIENLSGREKHFPLEVFYSMNYDLEHAHDERFVEALVQSEKMKKANIGKVAKKGFHVSEKSEWTALLKKYFTILIRPDWVTLNQSFEGDKEKRFLEAALKMEPLSVPSGGQANQSLLIYAGEQNHETLKSFNYGLEKLASRGWLGTFKVWLLIGLNFFYDYTKNYGWAIIILTLLIKGAFTPLTHMSFENMKKMQVLQPKLKALQERHKNDAQKLNQEMMQLYRRNKVNPMMGCLPMLLQIPVFIAFYQALSEAIELKGAPFIFWIKDLSEPDKLFTLPFTIPFLGDGFNILPLLMIGSMVWQQKLTPTTMGSPEQAKMMAWMPVIFGVMFYNMPSGLVLYWFINNVLSIIHQVFIKRIAIVLHHEDQD